MNEEVKKLIEEWHAEDQHQDIIDVLEQLPAEERDYDTICLLARAYNNTAEYAKAAELLESVREEGKEDALWNFRMGYSYYYRDNNAEALKYFNIAHELDPADEDAKFFIRRCNIELPLTVRVEKFWNWFVENECKLSYMINPESQEDAERFMEFIHEGTSLISENLNYNLGGDYEFSFAAEGWPDLFVIYPYIISRMPECLKAKWKFYPFNQGTDKSFSFRMFDADIDTERLMVRASYIENTGRFNIAYYEDSLNELPGNESDNLMWIILENTLGEGVSFKYINAIEPASEAGDDMISLLQLRNHIKETLEAHDRTFFENPKDIFSTYKLNPQKSNDLRYDIIIGSTCLESIISDYYEDSTDVFDHVNSFGAQAVFIAFPNPADSDGHDVLNLRHEIEDRISGEILDPMNLGQITGGATGSCSSYIDLIVFDVLAFADSVRHVLEQYPQCSFYMSDFRQHAQLIRLTESSEQREA